VPGPLLFQRGTTHSQFRNLKRQFFGSAVRHFVNGLTNCPVSGHGGSAETAQKLDCNVFHLLNLEHAF